MTEPPTKNPKRRVRLAKLSTMYDIRVRLESEVTTLSDPTLQSFKTKASTAMIILDTEPAQFRIPVRSLSKATKSTEGFELDTVLRREGQADEEIILLADDIPEVGVGGVGTGTTEKSEPEPRHFDYAKLAAGGWLHLAQWGEKTLKLTAWENDFAANVARQLSNGHPIAVKQRPHAERIVEKAESLGWSP